MSPCAGRSLWDIYDWKTHRQNKNKHTLTETPIEWEHLWLFYMSIFVWHRSAALKLHSRPALFKSRCKKPLFCSCVNSATRSPALVWESGSSARWSHLSEWMFASEPVFWLHLLSPDQCVTSPCPSPCGNPNAGVTRAGREGVCFFMLPDTGR